MRVRQGERECKGGGGAFKSGGASRKYEERTKEEELGAEEREGESAEGRVKGGRSLKGGTHSGRRLSCPFGSWPPRVTGRSMAQTNTQSEPLESPRPIDGR